jgi:hypothetical protein
MGHYEPCCHIPQHPLGIHSQEFGQPFVRETAYPPSPGTSYEGILQSGGSETEPSDSEEPGVYNNRRHVLSLNKLVFGNPYGTPQ